MLFTWLKRYADFKGRSSRKEYWLGLLCVFMLGVAAGILDIFVFAALSVDDIGPAQFVMTFGTIIPSVALGVRRLHDIGRTGAWVLLGLVPIIGVLVLLFWAVQPGQAQENKYGSPPPETPGLPTVETQAA